ncbi:MAG: flagellar hook-basal body complex protein FliE [Planctomycetes bacterium]|nr:flagellar hook-basal body complex protein FliE [Planctomycetota bacterium]
MENRPIGDASFRPIQPVGPQQPAHEVQKGDKSFREILGDTIAEVSARQQDADKAIEALATGQTDNLAEVLAAVEKADLAFRTLMQFRNKLVNAYEEISRLRI